MKLLFTQLLLWIVCAQLPLFGASDIIPVTPATLEQSNFVFKFNAKPVSGETDFSLTAIPIGETFSTFSGGLGIVEITQNTRQIKGVRSIPIDEKGKIYTANFHVEPDLLNTKDLCFIFTENVQVMMNGKVIPMPSATFYTFHLKDFISK